MWNVRPRGPTAAMTPTADRSAGAGGPADDGPRRPPRERALRRAAAALAAFALVVLAFLLALRQPRVGTWLANAILSRVTLSPRASAHVAEVRGDWIGWLELRGLTVMRGDTLLASADTLRARYRLGALLAGRLHVSDVAVLGVRVTADARDTTKKVSKKPPLTFGQVLAGRFYTGLPLRFERLRLADVTIGGHSYAPDTGFRITHLAARASELRLGRGFAFRLDSLAAPLRPCGSGRAPASLALACALASGRAELGRLRFTSNGTAVDPAGGAAGGGTGSNAGGKGSNVEGHGA